MLQVGPSEDVRLMEPANDLLGTGRLKQRLKEEGYLYLQDSGAKNSHDMIVHNLLLMASCLATRYSIPLLT